MRHVAHAEKGRRIARQEDSMKRSGSRLALTLAATLMLGSTLLSAPARADDIVLKYDDVDDNGDHTKIWWNRTKEFFIILTIDADGKRSLGIVRWSKGDPGPDDDTGKGIDQP